METLLNVLNFLHVISFVFMSVPLFNLIVVNERLEFGVPFNYNTDRYMENIIKNGANRCYVFQSTVLITGLLLLIFGDLGISTLWSNPIVLVKTILLLTLTGLLSIVAFSIQPEIEAILDRLSPEGSAPSDIAGQLKPHRAKRKKLANICLFLVITVVILGLQVRETFNPVLTIALVVVAWLFAKRATKTTVRLGWF